MAKKVVVYEMWAPSWSSLNEMCRHLERIAPLGITHVWLSGALESPWYDHGYDVSNYCRIGKRFVNDYEDVMEEFGNFVRMAHLLGMKVVIDLILNHTSTDHSWFRNHPERYCWSDRNHPGWKNLFDGGSAWKYNRKQKSYYLHLFHEKQADLKWFKNDEVNQDLVHEFQKIVSFWLKRKIDGFRLDIPQAINKDFSRSTLKMEDLLFGDKDDQVINALFPDKSKAPFLMMECFDPTHGELINHYTDETSVQFVMNSYVKSSADLSEQNFLRAAHQNEEAYGFMIHTEDHDSPRFTSRSKLTATDALWHLFNTQARAVCMYQGQELGLINPSQSELPAHRLCGLDAQTAMRAKSLGVDSLRASSRANARVQLPLDEYERQMCATNSYYKLTRELIARYHRL